MPIRIRCRHQWPHGPQLIEIAPIPVYFSGKSMALLYGQEIEDLHLMRIHLIIVSP